MIMLIIDNTKPKPKRHDEFSIGRIAAKKLVCDKQFLLEPKEMSISYFHLHLCQDGRCSLSTLIRASAWLGILSQRKYVCGLMETHPSILISNTRCSAMAKRETESLIILGI